MPIPAVAVGAALNIGLPLLLSLIARKAGPMVGSKLDQRALGLDSSSTTLMPYGSSLPASMGGNIARGVGNIGGNIIGLVGPTLRLGGTIAARSAQAAGVAGGAGVTALGQLARTSNTQRQREMYGDTATDKAADVVQGLAGAAGLGVSGVANAVGSTVDQAINRSRIDAMHKDLYNRQLEHIRQIQSMGVNPSTAHLAGRLISAESRVK